jgi:hypothetical protein
MAYMICASTPKTSVEVARDNPIDALTKLQEFEELGLTEVHVTTDAGLALTRDQIESLAAKSVPSAAVSRSF